MTSLHELTNQAHALALKYDVEKEGLEPLLADYIAQIRTKFDSAPQHIEEVSFFIGPHRIQNKTFAYQEYKNGRPVSVILSLQKRNPHDTSDWFGQVGISVGIPRGKTWLMRKEYILGKDLVGIVHNDGGINAYGLTNLEFLLPTLELIGELIDKVPWGKTTPHPVSVAARG